MGRDFPNARPTLRVYWMQEFVEQPLSKLWCPRRFAIPPGSSLNRPMELEDPTFQIVDHIFFPPRKLFWARGTPPLALRQVQGEASENLLLASEHFLPFPGTNPQRRRDSSVDFFFLDSKCLGTIFRELPAHAVL
ncbi:rCG24835 [Rattus norvegicus]|uniref:RCG24835 n=1 Tax=Rattus norvegicus TaxID=10116 RepID=A6JBZ0_RAT|nr:rCG24835 [Rattus norvegicus]